MKILGLALFSFAVLFNSDVAQASCDAAAAAVTTACETTPQSTVASQSSMSQAGSRDNMYEAAMEMATQLDAAANVNSSTAASCRAAGASCVSACTQEAAQLRAQKTECSSDSSEDSGACEANNEALEKAAAACDAKAAACASSSEASAKTFDSQASTLRAQAAQARKSAYASKGLRPPIKGPAIVAPPSSLSSSSGSNEKPLPVGARKELGDGECLNEKEAYRHSSCTGRYMKQCKDKMADSRCQNFAKHYCSSSEEDKKKEAEIKEKRAKKEKEIEEKKKKAKEDGVPYVASDDDIDENKYFRESGTGMGSGFCQYATALQFCSTGASGKTQCPSCIYGTNLRACDGDITPCLATIPNGVREDAVTSCPSDPLFLNPKFSMPPAGTGAAPVAQ